MTFARQHGVERVVDSYADLFADPEVDVVYKPLPNGLHAYRNSRALQAGKHVLSEKPSASNAEAAAAVADTVRKAGTTFMEAFHYLFHPVTRRVLAIVESGELGRIMHVAMVAACMRYARWVDSPAVLPNSCRLGPASDGRRRVAERGVLLPRRSHRIRPVPHGILGGGDDIPHRGDEG